MRRKGQWLPLLLLLMAVGGGCATIPTGPSVLVLPGTGKTLEQFQADDALCRQWAAQAVTRTATGETYGVNLQWQYDMRYQQCMFAKGNRVPAGPVLGASPPPPPQSSPPTAPAPPPAGSVPGPLPKAP